MPKTINRVPVTMKWFRKDRGRGKTTTALQQWLPMKESLIVFPNQQMLQNILNSLETYPISLDSYDFTKSELRDRMCTWNNYTRKMEGRYFDELIIDELPADPKDVFYFLKDIEQKFHECSAPSLCRDITIYYS